MKGPGKIIRTALSAGASAVILVCLAASFGVSKASRNKTVCNDVSVTIRDSLQSRFVSGKDILEFLDKGYGKTEGIPVNDLDLKEIEAVLDSQSAVLKSEAYCTKDGVLHIDVTQRKPLMRFQKGTKGFYADAHGYIFPMKTGKSSYVVVIDGEIPLHLENTDRGKATSGDERLWLEQMTELVEYMNGHQIWVNNIVQIHVEKNGDLILIPREGKERFIFGKPSGLEEKFSLMDCYYTGIVPVKGKDYYRTVDLRYDGQIICK